MRILGGSLVNLTTMSWWKWLVGHVEIVSFGGTYFFILFDLSSILAEGFLAELCWVKYCSKHVGFAWSCYFWSPQGCFFNSPPSRTLQSTTWSSCLAKRCSQSGRSWPRRPLAVCSLPSPWTRLSWWVQEESTFIRITCIPRWRWLVRAVGP